MIVRKRRKGGRLGGPTQTICTPRAARILFSRSAVAAFAALTGVFKRAYPRSPDQLHLSGAPPWARPPPPRRTSGPLSLRAGLLRARAPVIAPSNARIPQLPRAPRRLWAGPTAPEPSPSVSPRRPARAPPIRDPPRAPGHALASARRPADHEVRDRLVHAPLEALQ